MRESTFQRKTKETDVTLTLSLDGKGTHSVDTGIGFFDHMLQLFAVHSGFDLKLTCKGDLHVDGHHTVEDVGIVLGQAIAKLLGDKRGITRYGDAVIPMDEALVAAYLDLSGRPFLAYSLEVSGKTGAFDTELAEEFFRAVVSNAGITLHLRQLDGKNNHHIIEAAFKAFARALRQAVAVTGTEIPSSKGTLV